MKKQIIKKIVTMLLSSAIAVFMIISTMAAPGSSGMGVAPLWDSINYVEVDIIFDGNEAEILGLVERQSSATSIEATLTLYEKVGGQWEYVCEWYESTTHTSLSIVKLVDVSYGMEYKAVLEVTAYTGLVAETSVFECEKKNN